MSSVVCIFPMGRSVFGRKNNTKQGKYPRGTENITAQHTLHTDIQTSVSDVAATMTTTRGRGEKKTQSITIVPSGFGLLGPCSIAFGKGCFEF